MDGPLATSSAGSPVRLLELAVAGNTVSAGRQYVYQVEKIHGSLTFGSPQSGLTDLVALPDGTLLALERSVAVTSPLYLNRIFEVSFDLATDVSVAWYSSGLIDQPAYVSVGKELLWAGAADGSNGQNLEGLTLGPRLPNGNWTLLGVVDDGDTLSSNTIVSFELSANPSADFDGDNDIDAVDFLAWQRGFGISIEAAFSSGDADRDGDIDQDDLAYWESSLAIAVGGVDLAVPEPSSSVTTCLLVLLSSITVRFRTSRHPQQP